MNDGNETTSAAAVEYDWRAEVVRVWRALPDKPLFFGLLIPWLLWFHLLGNATLGYVHTHSLFGWLVNAYSNSGDDSHGFLVPFLVLALYWWKREELLALEKAPWAPGLVLVGLGVTIHVVGYGVQLPRISFLGFLVGLYGITGLVWGRKWLRATAFPFVLLLFCMPVASLADALTVPLRLLVAKLAVGVSQVGLGIEVIREGSLIFDPEGTFQYDVAPACSGIRSLTALMIITLVCSFVWLKRNWQRLTVLALAIPVAVAGNVLRITAVIVAAEAFGQETGKQVHDHAWVLTWGLAVGCMGGMFAFYRRLGANAAGPGEGMEVAA